jgi:hypothetical protein
MWEIRPDKITADELFRPDAPLTVVLRRREDRKGKSDLGKPSARRWLFRW